VGFVISAKPGDRVEAGEALASVYAGDGAGMRIGLDALDQAIRIVEEPPPAPLPLISHRVTAEAVETIQPAGR
jgi:thymidine phosphorylase